MTPKFFGVGLFLLVPLFLAVAQPPAASPAWEMSTAGMIADPILNEISGIAVSRKAPERLWVLNDSGNQPALYALSDKGELLGTLEIAEVKNKDWEDLASFSLEGKDYLLIGDMGDNGGMRRDCRLVLVEEPAGVSGKVKPVAVIPFSYEDGPRDVESLAVDVKAKKVLLLSKREKITALYELPLVLKSPAEPLVAKKIATMESLPQPTDADRQANPMGAAFLGQPTGMDLSADGSVMVILTYQEAFVYRRKPDESWTTAVQRVPETLPRHQLVQAEAVCFSQEGQIIFVTTERKLASPLLRYELKK